VASEGSVEWCRGGNGVWIYPSSRIDRGGRIYGACVCVRRRWLCCIARSRRAVHFRGGRSVVAVRPGDVIYQTDGSVIPLRLYIRAYRPRVAFPTTPICTRRSLYTAPSPFRVAITLQQPFRGTSDQSRADIRTHPPTHALSGTRSTPPPRLGDINLTCLTIYHYHYFYF